MADQDADTADVELTLTSASSSNTSPAYVFSSPAYFSEATPATPHVDQTPAKQQRQQRTKHARTADRDRTRMKKYLPTLFQLESSSDSDGSSSDASGFDFEKNFLPPTPRALDPSTRRSSTVERRPQPLPIPSSLFDTSILDLNLPASGVASPNQGSTDTDSRTCSPTSPLRSQGSNRTSVYDSGASSPLALTTGSSQGAYAEPFSIPLPCGFEYAGLKQVFDSIDSLVESMNTATTAAASDAYPACNAIINTEPKKSVLSLAKTPAAMRIPSEIINQIYLHLHPSDMNSARHICRTWMNASLNHHFLGQMLRRGGWWSSFRRFAKQRHISLTTQTLETTWLMSCFLSRECALSGGWLGNGLPLTNNSAVTTCDHHWGHRVFHTCTTPRRSLIRVAAFREVAHVRFAELTCGRRPLWSKSGLIFEASVCGQYILVAEGSMIHVFELVGTTIQALTGVMCPRQVMAMSMDVTSRRITVAALLEGRMGIMCSFRLRSESGGKMPVGRSNSIASNESPSSSESTTPGDRNDVIDVQSDSEATILADDHTEAGRRRSSIDQTWNTHLPPVTLNSPTECEKLASLTTGQRSIYHQLCSDEDPPRSIALCPKRRCVAFGCAGGIELHWKDTHTGQDLSRWFPLTGPADHLYFIPPRVDHDSPRKLRLISTAAHPSQRATIALKFTATRVNAEATITNTFSGFIGFGRQSSPNIEGTVSDCDHYCAVPMVDGYHILFVDPDSGMLCMGSDTVAGDARRVLRRKIFFLPPSAGAVPLLYTSSYATSRSPRIVARYGDLIVLFSIPSDIFGLSTKEQQPGGLSKDDVERAQEWLRWWPKDDIPANHPGSPPEEHANQYALWPLFIRGTVIGRLQGLSELTLNTNSGRLSIWAFGSGGESVVWQVDDGTLRTTLTQCNIGKDGQVQTPFQVEMDGDVVMQDAPDVSSSDLDVGRPNANTVMSPIDRRATVSDDELTEQSREVDGKSGDTGLQDEGVFMMDAL